MAGIGLQRKQLDARLGRRARPEETSVEDQVKLQGAGAGLQIAGNLALQIYENQGKASMLDAEGKVKLAGIQYRQDFLKKLQKTEDVNEIAKTINDFQSGIEQNWSKSVGDAEKSVVPGYRGAFRSQMKRKGQLNGMSMQSFSEGAGNTEIKGVLQEKFNLAMQGGDLEYASALVVGGAAYFGSSTSTMISQINKIQKDNQKAAFENDLISIATSSLSTPEEGVKNALEFGSRPETAKEYGLTGNEAKSVMAALESKATTQAAQAKEALAVQQETDYEAWWDSRRNGKLNNADMLDKSSLDAKTKNSLNEMDKADAEKILKDEEVKTDTITNIQVRALIDQISTGDITFNDALVKYAELSPKIDKKTDEPKFLDRMFTARGNLRDKETAELIKRNTETLQSRERYIRSAIGKAVPVLIAELDIKLKRDQANELANEMAEMAVIDLVDSFPDKKSADRATVDAKTNEILAKYRMSSDAMARAVDNYQKKLKSSEKQRAAAQKSLIRDLEARGLQSRADEVRRLALDLGLDLGESETNSTPPPEKQSGKWGAFVESLKGGDW